jgi:hypothetical protein
MYVHTKKPFVYVILSVSCDHMGIILYLEYQNVCPFVRTELDPPAPSPTSECVNPLKQRGGGATLACG